jgi:light-regulated signal transduction histidine kinase (bacteriophytochrome)
MDIITPIQLRQNHSARRYTDLKTVTASKTDLEKEIVERRKAQELFREANETLEQRVKERTAELETTNKELELANKNLAVEITERKKAEEALQQRTTKLEAANKELEAFSYSISHDLRQPLRALESFSGLLTEEYKDKLDATGKDYLNRVRKASQYMSQLTDDMLKLSRINRGDMFRDQVDLSEIAQSIIKELSANQPVRKAEIKISSGLLVEGDKALLTIAMRNLLENAWKFTSKCQVTRIELGELHRDGEKVYFIQDNGAGFDMQYKDKLFQPFQRLHTNKEYEGTGIGLAIVQRIISRHGGKIWAESEKEKGSTFYFTLS